jgi:hypothetical protein
MLALTWTWVPSTSNGAANPGRQLGGSRGGVLHEDRELVAPEPRGRIRGAQALLDAPGDTREQPVARDVAE